MQDAAEEKEGSIQQKNPCGFSVFKNEEKNKPPLTNC